MTRFLSPLLMLLAVLALAACGGDADTTKSGDGDKDPDKHHAEGDHDESDHHDGDDHDHDDHGETTDQGTKVAGPAKVSLGLYGDVKAGFEAIMDITIADMKPEAVRVWVGVESAKGSMKAKLDENDDGVYHGHVDVPTKMPDGSAIWIELAAEDNTRHRCSFPIQ